MTLLSFMGGGVFAPGRGKDGWALRARTCMLTAPGLGLPESPHFGAQAALRSGYSEVGDLRDTKGYIEHPVPDQVFHTKPSDIDHWSWLPNRCLRVSSRETQDSRIWVPISLSQDSVLH